MTRALINKTATLLFILLLLNAHAAAHPPWGIAVDAQGRVYFSALEAVWKIDAEGRLTLFRAGLSGRHTHELTLDEAGNLYGEDLTYKPATERWISALWKMTPAGDFSYLLAPTDNPPKGLSMWRDARGNTYSVQRDTPAEEPLLVRRSPDGNLHALSGSSAALEKRRQTLLYNLGGAAFGADGAFYFTDGRSVRKLGADGAVTFLTRGVAAATAVAGSSRETSKGDSHAHLLGLSVDARGQIYAADLAGRRLLKITPDGQASTVLQSGEEWMPTGVAHRDGNLYVLEFRSAHGALVPRVRRLSADGKVSVLATVGESRSIARPETRNGEKVEAVATHGRRSVSYKLMSACALALVLAFVAWGQVRRRGVV